MAIKNLCKLHIIISYNSFPDESLHRCYCQINYRLPRLLFFSVLNRVSILKIRFMFYVVVARYVIRNIYLFIRIQRIQTSLTSMFYLDRPTVIVRR